MIERTCSTASAACRKRQPAPWYKKRKIGRQKVSKCLTPKEYDELLEAWPHARRRGTPLNTFITIRPREIDQLTPAERWQLWQKTYNQLTRYARYKQFEFVALWVRESDRDLPGMGEHLHALMWIPDKHWDHFNNTVKGWFDGPAAVNIKPASQATRRNRNGKALSAIGYLTKAAPPQRTRYNPTILYRLSGPILGRRSGMTRNLKPKAIAVWRAQQAIRNEFQVAA
jgi:hypothetical protein